MTTMSSKEFFNCYWDYLLIDTRCFEDYSMSRIAHSMNISDIVGDEFWNTIKDCFPEKRDKIIFYSDSSVQAKTFLHKVVTIFRLHEEKVKKILRCNLFPTIYILAEDFFSFKNKYPYLCTPEYRDDIVYPSMITENLFLSGKQCANSERVIEDLRIKVIINCTNDLPNSFEQRKNIKYYRVPIEDSCVEDLLPYIPEIISFINENKDKRILLHCQRGQSRSASILIAYLMKTNKWLYDKTLKYVKLSRPYIKPNSSFENQLKTLEQLET